MCFDLPVADPLGIRGRREHQNPREQGGSVLVVKAAVFFGKKKSLPFLIIKRDRLTTKRADLITFIWSFNY